MSKFEEACLHSCENWVDSFPDEIPEHKFSKKHNKRMRELVDISPDEGEHRLSKKSIRILLIAAVLIIGTVTAFANQTSREFIVTKFSNHSEYDVAVGKKAKKVRSLTVNYVPEGFEKVEDYGYAYVYKNGDKEFIVDKSTIDASIGYNTEKYDDEIIEINSMKAVYFRGDYDHKGILFNNGDYIFDVEGNIEKEELVKIAQNIE